MSLNPWVALILGVLFGWLFGWLLERWFFRRRRMECEEQLQRVEGELRAQDDALRAARARTSALEADIAAAKLAAAAPAPQPGAVDVTSPRIDVALPQAEVEAHRLAAALPEVVPPQVELEAPKAEVDWPTLSAEVGQVEVEAPGISIEAPVIGAELPAVEAGLPGAAIEALAPTAVAAADDLTRLEGIGPVYAARLKEAGSATFAELAAADEARLAEIIAAPAWRKVNYGEWIEQARLAAASDEAGLAALQARLFSRKGDNLTLVSGVGEKAAQALTAAGIASFAGLAAATPERLAEITRTAGVRGGDFDAWIAEAQLRAAGKRISKPKQVRARKTVSCPQDLSRIKGIGTVFETKLYAAGIGTFWDLSQTSREALAQILEIRDFQNVDLAALQTEALRLAEETDTLNRSWDGTPPDDFEPLEGIGEVYEGRLYNAGICTYRALAEATVEQLAAICQAPEWRKPDYGSWIAQAQRLLGQEA